MFRLASAAAWNKSPCTEAERASASGGFRLGMAVLFLGIVWETPVYYTIMVM